MCGEEKEKGEGDRMEGEEKGQKERKGNRRRVGEREECRQARVPMKHPSI